MKAVRKHVKEQWILLYIGRWLKAPFQTEKGEIILRTAGTPQGGVISPNSRGTESHPARMDELFWQVQSFGNETHARLRAKTPDKVGYVQVQEFPRTPSKSRRMAMPS